MTQAKPIPALLLDDPEIRAKYVNRILSKVSWPADAAGCWEWVGGRMQYGHGRIRYAESDAVRNLLPHRVMFAWWYGDTDQILDHLCDNPPCINPMHLTESTLRDNTLRSPIANAAVNARKTHCKYGHPFSGDNLYINPKGHRYCRECKRVSGRRLYHEGTVPDMMRST